MIINLYLPLFALLFIFLSVRTISIRRKFKVSLGDAGNESLQRSIRAHGNFSEYAPFTLFLIFILESNAMNSYIVHTLLISFFIGRAVHAYSIIHKKSFRNSRTLGMALTFTCLIVTSFLISMQALSLI